MLSRSVTIALLLVALLAAASVGTVAQEASPDTPATQQLSRWLEAFNAEDRSTMQRFIDEHFPTRPNRSVDPDLNFRAQTGGFDLLRVEQATSTRAVALLKERDAEATGVRISLEVEAAAPHRIVKLEFQPGVRLPVSIPRMSERELSSALQRELMQRTANDRFSGAVLIGRNDETVFSAAYGFADRERKKLNRVDSQFRIGSMNKMFTAVAVLQLVQNGKVNLEDPIGKYLPDFPNKNIASKVTVEHLLTHTGGTGDFFGPEFNAHRLQLRDHDDYVRLFASRELLFEPGSRFMYSNFGFILLGSIIEHVSGQSYYDYVQANVFEPAGMKATGSEPEERAPKSLTVGYTRRPGEPFQSNANTLPYRGTSAGGGYSTVGDLLRFANALLSHKLLDAHHTELLTSGKVEAFGGKYAYGFIERHVNGVRSIGHGGTAQGMNGDLIIFPKSGYIVVVLANMDPPAAQRVSDFIANRLPL